MTFSQGSHHRVIRLLALGAFLTALACTEETIVFRDRQVFNPPPDGALVGYFDPVEGLTTCGNCHAEKQAEWEQTGHAGAYDGLVNSGHAQDFCFGCHTVSELGNAAEEPAGWNAVEDSAYHDVQCESCHGSALGHLESPGELTAPPPSLAVGVDLLNGCGECHQGEVHHPFVNEWEMSPHANVVGFAAAREDCAPCHRGQGSLEAWGVRGPYLEKDAAEHLPVTCGVCHDPHSNVNKGQLRFPVESPNLQDNLCAQCHNRRTVPDPESSHGLEPHAPEAALLIGEAGFFFPGIGIDQGDIQGTHGSEGNPDGCATCHVTPISVVDDATGELTFEATGHLFRPIPCIDPDTGRPLSFENDCELSTTARSFAGCAISGCHGGEDVAFDLLDRALNGVPGNPLRPGTVALNDSLLVLLKIVEANTGGDSTDLEAAGGEIDPTVATLNVAEQAFFNHALLIHGDADFTTNTPVGSTVHNPFLMEALLAASIAAMEDEYAAILFPSGQPASNWDAVIQNVLERSRQ